MSLDAKALDLFESAIDLPQETQRQYIQNECDGDQELLKKVLELLAAAVEHDHFLATPLSTDQSLPDRIGSYRILREIGRGGMGVVYEAEHDAMQRRVALKVLATGASPNQTQLTRFYREARAAGQLHHTNIVPVFEVGSAGNQHYYTMQFIEGAALDVVIDFIRGFRDVTSNSTDELSRTITMRWLEGTAQSDSNDCDTNLTDGPSDLTNVPVTRLRREALRSAADPAKIAKNLVRARDSDRQRSHRIVDSGSNSSSVFSSPDWSPGNSTRIPYFRRVAAIGLQAADALDYAHQHGTLHRDIKPANLILDAQGNVWVLDFGLAKSEDDGLTVTGDVVGTLRYMAPERFEGTADARSDVYSLGLSLYELCTLKSAFDAQDRATLLKQVASQVPLVPRKIDPRIPRDLETIILKAIDRSPKQRYQTAAEMVDDLRLFSMDHPIAARRTSKLERAWKVCRRNPVVSGLTATLLLMLIVVAFGASWFGYVNQQEKARAVRAEFIATQRNYELAYQRAHGLRSSIQPGRRFQSIASIREAVELLPKLNLPDRELAIEEAKLRSEAIAAMTLLDLQEGRSWNADGEWGRLAAFTHDYRMLAQAHQSDGRVRIRRVDDETYEYVIHTAFTKPWYLEFSPNGKFLFTQHRHESKGGMLRLCIWAVDSSHPPTEPLITCETHARGTAAFSAVTESVVMAMPDRLDVYTLPVQKLVMSIPTDFQPAKLAVADDRNQLAVAAIQGQNIQFWDFAKTPELLHEIDLGNDPSNLRCFDWIAEKGILVAGMYDGTILVWRDFNYDKAERYALHKGAVAKVVIHPSADFVLTQAWDETVRSFDLETRGQTLRLERSELANMRFDKAGDRIGFSTSDDHKFGYWRIHETPLRQWKLDLSDLPTDATYRDVHIHPQHDQLVVTTNAKRVEFWDTARDSKLASLEHLETPFAQFTSRGDQMYFSGPNGLQRISMKVSLHGSIIKLELGDPETIVDERTDRFALSSDEKSVFVNISQTLHRIDLDDPSNRVEIGSHSGMSNVTASQDGKWVATGTWRGVGVRVWDARSGILAKELLPGIESTYPQFSADGSFLGAADTNAIHIWNCDTWTEVKHNATRRIGSAGRLTFTHDSRFMVADKTRYLPQLIDVGSGKWVTNLAFSMEDTPRAYAFTSDGSRLAVIGGSYLFVWDLASAKRRLRQLELDWN